MTKYNKVQQFIIEHGVAGSSDLLTRKVWSQIYRNGYAVIDNNHSYDYICIDGKGQVTVFTSDIQVEAGSKNEELMNLISELEDEQA